MTGKEIRYIIEFKILSINCKGKAYYDEKKQKDIYKTAEQRVLEIWERQSVPIPVPAIIFESETVPKNGNSDGKPNDNHRVTVMGISRPLLYSEIEIYKGSVTEIASEVKEKTKCGPIEISFRYIDETRCI